MLQQEIENIAGFTEQTPVSISGRPGRKDDEVDDITAPCSASVLRYCHLMPEDDDTDAPPPLLACGHRWNGTEDWSEMAVILKETLDGADGPQPAISTGHYCRACRAGITGERFNSLAEAEVWLRHALASL